MELLAIDQSMMPTLIHEVFHWRNGMYLLLPRYQIAADLTPKMHDMMRFDNIRQFSANQKGDDIVATRLHAEPLNSIIS